MTEQETFFVQRQVWLLERGSEYGFHQAHWFIDKGDTFRWTPDAAAATPYASKEEAEAAATRWAPVEAYRFAIFAVATDHVFLGRVLLGSVPTPAGPRSPTQEKP